MNIFKNLAITVLMITFLIILSIKVEATTGTINSETVRLRKEPNTQSTILDQLDKGDEVEILEQADGWYKVIATIDGQKITGYISESLLDVENFENTNNKEQPEQNPEENVETEQSNNEDNSEKLENNGDTAQPTTNGQPETENTLNIEEGKTYQLNKAIETKILPLINSVNNNTINSGNVNVVEIINDWCKIENGTQEGWVRINNLKNSISGTSVEQNVSTNDNTNSDGEKETVDENNDADNDKNTTVIRTAYVSASSLKVRKEATTSSEVIDSLKLNDQVSIIEELDGWYKIKIGDQLGYVSATYISNEKTEETTSRGNVNRQEETNSTVETSNSEPIVTGTSGVAVVEYAKQYLGYKYVSGGSSPSTGFDCSGFTSYVYKQFGVTLSRTSKGQINNGVGVEKSNLQPGDIVIFNNESNTSIGHVGIYVGSGNFIHAANPSEGVKITSLSSSYYSTRYVGARRVI